MKKFTARYKDQDQGGKWHDMRCVFPLNYGARLDEQLDECYLNTILDPKEEYLPTTEVEIVIDDDGTEVTQNYIVASDNAMECPIGSGKYKHELHLIEPTKLMEGIICQSLAFTNTSIINPTPVPAPPIEFEIPGTAWNGIIPPRLNQGYIPSYMPLAYETPNEYGNKLKIRAIDFFEDALVQQLRVTHVDGAGITYTIGSISEVPPALPLYTESYSSCVTVKTNNGVYSTKNLHEELIIQNFTTAKISYTVYMSVGENVVVPDGTVTYYGFGFEYNLFALEEKNPLAKWTVWEAAERVIQQAEPRFWVGDVEEGICLPSATRFILDDRQKDWLSKVLTPEFTMTQCTLREQLKLIGSFVHAEPRLIKREGQWVVTFEPYATGNVASSGAYVYKGNSRSINQYCTDIRTTANNIVNRLDYNDGVVVTPNDGGAVTLRTDTVNVRVEDNENSYALTSQEIYDIPTTEKSVEVAIYDGEGNEKLGFTDITAFVVEKTQYEAQFSSYDKSDGKPVKNMAIYYERGQKGLHGLFFKPPNVVNPSLEDYSIVRILEAASGRPVRGMMSLVDEEDKLKGNYNRLAFRISYIPIYSALFSHGKQSHVLTDRLFPFSQIYNQSENIIETRYYGENIKGVAARLGNAEQTRTYRLPSLSLVPRIGDTIDGLYVASTDVSVLPFYVKCTVALTRDFNRLSQYVGISSNKRVYEVSESQAYNRNILLKEYVLVGDKPSEKPAEEQTLANTSLFRYAKALISIFTRNTGIIPITAVCAWGGTRKYPVFGNTAGHPVLPVVLLPVISSAFGNSMLFSWTYKDNYSAGERVDDLSEGGVSGYFQSDVGYCDFFGRMRWYNFFLIDRLFKEPKESEYEDEEGNINKNEYEEALKAYHEKVYSFALSYPSISEIPFVSLLDDKENPTGIGTIIPSGPDTSNPNNFKSDFSKPYFIDKDSREILCFNFEIEFKAARDGLVIGSGMPFYCELVGSRPRVGHARIISLDRPVQQLQRNIREIIPEISKEAGVELQNEHFTLEDGSLRMEHAMLHSKYWCIYAPLNKNETTVQNDDGEIGTEITYEGGEIILAGRRTDRPIYLTPVHDIYS